MKRTLWLIGLSFFFVACSMLSAQPPLLEDDIVIERTADGERFELRDQSKERLNQLIEKVNWRDDVAYDIREPDYIIDHYYTIWLNDKGKDMMGYLSTESQYYAELTKKQSKTLREIIKEF